MGVVAISGDDVVIFSHEGNAADGDGLLADVKVEESPHRAALVVLEGDLFKSADTHHFAIQLDFFIGGKVSIDGVLGGGEVSRGGHKEGRRVGRCWKEASGG